MIVLVFGAIIAAVGLWLFIADQLTGGGRGQAETKLWKVNVSGPPALVLSALGILVFLFPFSPWWPGDSEPGELPAATATTSDNLPGETTTGPSTTSTTTSIPPPPTTGPSTTSTTTSIPPPPTVVEITFGRFPDGASITNGALLDGTEFLAQGVTFAGAPVGPYCEDARVTAIRTAGTYGVAANFLTTALPTDAKACNGVPVEVSFSEPVRLVELEFEGASVTYRLEAFDMSDRFVDAKEVDAEFGGGSFTIGSEQGASVISRVTFGAETAITAVISIRYER